MRRLTYWAARVNVPSFVVVIFVAAPQHRFERVRRVEVETGNFRRSAGAHEIAIVILSAPLAGAQADEALNPGVIARDGKFHSDVDSHDFRLDEELQLPLCSL